MKTVDRWQQLIKRLGRIHFWLHINAEWVYNLGPFMAFCQWITAEEIVWEHYWRSKKEEHLAKWLVEGDKENATRVAKILSRRVQ